MVVLLMLHSAGTIYHYCSHIITMGYHYGYHYSHLSTPNTMPLVALCQVHPLLMLNSFLHAV